MKRDARRGTSPEGSATPARPMDRVWSWVADRRAQEERTGHAQGLVAHRLETVRYFELDPSREQVAPGHRGPRSIVDAAEWRDPLWMGRRFDAVDHGIELDVTGGRTFSATWDPVGEHEGIGLREVPLLGTALLPDADVAVWDVGRRSRWQPHIGQAIVDVELRYAPWSSTGGFWCPRITLRFETGSVELLLGDRAPDGQLDPSSDNIAVLFDADLPGWLSSLS